MSSLKALVENLDELTAVGIVAVGLYLIVRGDNTDGYSLVTMGTGYLFGKSMPKKGKPSGLPAGY